MKCMRQEKKAIRDHRLNILCLTERRLHAENPRLLLLQLSTYSQP